MVQRRRFVYFAILPVAVLLCLAGWVRMIEHRTVVTDLGEPRVLRKQGESEVLNAPNTVFCDLLHSPEVYKDQLVRLRGIHYVGREVSGFYDPKCDDAKSPVDLEYESAETFTDARKIFAGVGSYPESEYPKRAEVLVVGKMDCSDKRGYGHLNSFKCQFKVARVEEAKEVPADIPWRF